MMNKTLCNVSERHIYILVKLNIIPHYKFKSAIRFDPAEIDRWIEDNYHSVKAGTQG